MIQNVQSHCVIVYHSSHHCIVATIEILLESIPAYIHIQFLNKNILKSDQQ